MRERLGNVLRCFAAAIADAALSALLVALMLALYDAERTVRLDAGAWACALLIQALVNELLAAFGPSLLVYIGANTAMALAARHFVLAGTVFIPGSHGFPILLGLMVLTSCAHSAFCAQKLPPSDLFVRLTDALIVAAAGYLAIAFVMGRALNASVLAFVLFAFALLLATTAALRAGGESDSVIRGTGVGGWLVLGALFMLCLLLTGALLGMGGGHVESLVELLKAIWAVLSRGMMAAIHAFAYVLAFFIRPAKVQRQYVQSDSAALPDAELIETADTPEWVALLFLVLIGVLVLAAIAAILWALHGVRLSPGRSARRRRRVTRRSHFLDALRALLRRVISRISFEIACCIHRRTPQGLLVLAMRRGRLCLLPRRPSESGGAYLRRYAAALEAQDTPSTLTALADHLDALFYGGAAISLSAADSREYAAQIRRLRPPLPAIDKNEKRG